MTYESMLLKLEELIYTKINALTLSYMKDKEPFPLLPNGHFSPIEIGDSWGEVFDCAWFKLLGRIPPHEGNLVLLADIGGEGLVYQNNPEHPHLQAR
ncbi:MAG: hypothetical protein JEZ05_10950 [Tenericutes bacterium]|nr:hypothetical protein [Mycoplasmatota bacterium]